jgi:N-methylhydantoinase B
MKLLRANVRTPDEVLGDLHAQVAANQVGGQRLLEMMQEFDLESLDTIADEIITRSERAMREAIRRLPDGVYRNSLTCDGWDEPITIQAQVRVADDTLAVDFTGTSPEVPYGVNVVLNYTIAYTTYALKAIICPEVPNNEGSFRPVHIHAPEGSVLNCRRPAPVAARHVVGHFAPECVLGALYHLLPERALAEGANTIWNIQAAGYWPSGAPFRFVSMMAGGMGARASKDGLSAAIFPSGIRGTPVEIVESASPLVLTHKALRRDSGGPGAFRGGLGQEVHLRVRSERPFFFTAMFDRTKFPARGLRGGAAGAPGAVYLDDGTPLAPKGKHAIPAERTLILQLPGGGGYGSPYTRPPAQVLEDVRNGFVSCQQAEAAYGVVIDTQTWTVDAAATAQSRAQK